MHNGPEDFGGRTVRHRQMLSARILSHPKQNDPDARDEAQGSTSAHRCCRQQRCVEPGLAGFASQSLRALRMVGESVFSFPEDLRRSVYPTAFFSSATSNLMVTRRESCWTEKRPVEKNKTNTDSGSEYRAEMHSSCNILNSDQRLAQYIDAVHYSLKSIILNKLVKD